MQRLTRLLFSWPTLRWLLAATAGFILLVLLLRAVEDWRGRRAWRALKSELEARGEKLDLRAFEPPPIADEQNFASIPLFEPLFNYTLDPETLQPQWENPEAVEELKKIEVHSRAEIPLPRQGTWLEGEKRNLNGWAEHYRKAPDFHVTEGKEGADAVLDALKRFDREVEQLRTAAQRPYARYQNRYEPPAPRFDHLTLIMNLVKILSLRSVAELQLGKSEAALADVKLALRLLESLRNEPTLIAHLVRVSVLNILMQPIWEGMIEHRWNENQLRALQDQLQKLNFLEDHHFALKSERAFGNQMFDFFRENRRTAARFLAAHDFFDIYPSERFLLIILHLIPEGWFYQNQAAYNRFVEEMALPVVKPSAHRVDSEVAEQNEQRIKEIANSPYNLLTRASIPVVSAIAIRTAQAQTVLDQAVVSCALERYRLMHDEYPQALELLSPRYMETIPRDLFTGEPLKYQLRKSGYLLYSVGWNRKDEGGTDQTKKRSSRIERKEGDWVWPQVRNAAGAD